MNTTPSKIIPISDRLHSVSRASAERALLRLLVADHKLDDVTRLALCDCPACRAERSFVASQQECEKKARDRRMHHLLKAYFFVALAGLSILAALLVVLK